MFRGGRYVACAIAGALFLGAPASASAYDPQRTHRWITRQAAERLVAAHPGKYDELLTYLDEVAAGAEEEDHNLLDGDSDPFTLRVMRHFFRPTDGAGLFMVGQQFPNSYDWAAQPNDVNEWDWFDGLAAWQHGDKARAYRTLGHVVHLIQDATVPAHTHLDIHGPPDGDDYEDYCKTQITNEFTSALPVPPPGTPLPVFDSAWNAWMATASASYQRNLYPGDLSDQAQARGRLAEMFPTLAWSWFFEEWRIGDPAVGSLGDDFVEEEPGLYYFSQTEFPAAVDKRFAGGDPSAEEWFENHGGAPMAARMAEDLVPIAILHSAAVMQLYLDEMYAKPVDPPGAEPDPDTDEPSAPAGCQAAPGGLGPDAFAAIALSMAALLLLSTLRRRKI
jgi:hypothetical protein